VRKRIGLLAAWLLAAVLTVSIGVVAVSTVGAAIRNRGPIGEEVVRSARNAEAPVTPDPKASAVRHTFRGEYGAFVVECRGLVAEGIAARPASGWRTVSHDPGPDDDVDVTFAAGRRSAELEVFCNRGRPTLAELERHLLDDDRSGGDHSGEDRESGHGDD
jgi:hypothetical protein